MMLMKRTVVVFITLPLSWHLQDGALLLLG